MKTMITLGLLLVASLSYPLLAQPGDKAMVINVWPSAVPGEAKPIKEETITGQQGSRRIENVSRPTLTVFRPAKEKDTGAAVVIAPGGGYNILAWDHEGLDVAAWLNSIGVTGIVLKYRIPRRPEHPKYPLQDAQRALSLVRSKATEWGIDPNRVGMLGFSAGGHLTAVTATNFDKRTYEPIDDVDKLSCRPDFVVMVYSGGVMPKGSDTLIPEFRVTKDTPPAFLVHCHDDKVSPEQSALMYLALKRAGVSAELHIYASGGHGFGMRTSKNPVAEWPRRCEEWMASRKILGRK